VGALPTDLWGVELGFVRSSATPKLCCAPSRWQPCCVRFAGPARRPRGATKTEIAAQAIAQTVRRARALRAEPGAGHTW